MRAQDTGRWAWLEGFAAGVAVCGLAVYAKQRYRRHRPRFVHEDGTVIPIE